ncbi:MAG: mitochondrial fission ELM1 family protein [Candidatus Contendobacter sp.]|nr:mitochondrial fission ELM1 family protein [Candidatus Contendobacter sp.]
MQPLVIWRFCDGKAGHDHQSQGLLEALARLRQVESFTLNPPPVSQTLFGLMRGALAAWRGLPAPDLLIGAGHGAHLALLAARRCRGGKIIVLMRPTLPLSLFDLCLIPDHDSPPSRPNILPTRGALNHLQPSATLEPDRGLLLIGGPSAHFGWDNAGLHRQIAAIVAADPAMRWTLTTSRRTPPDFLDTPFDPRLTIIPVAETSPDWLPTQLAQAGQAWVTGDSVSMVYEALTVGAAVGILDVPHLRPNRVSRGLAQLTDQGWVTPFAHWRQKQTLHRPPQPFNEAERCARWIVEQWLA